MYSHMAHKWLFDHNYKIFVTGATGWVGRSFLHELQLLLSPPQFSASVFAFASRSTVIKLTCATAGYSKKLHVHPLSDIVEISRGQNVLCVHTAFLTKDRLAKYSQQEFMDINIGITKVVGEALDVASNAKLLEISSGAAALAEETSQSSRETAIDLYGYLKLCEEKDLAARVETQVLRIYALTGRFIRDPRSFAIGDFLFQAIQGKAIELSSTSPVVRGYANASNVAQGSLRWLLSGDRASKPIAAITHVVALTALVREISLIYNLPPPMIPPFSGTPSSYSSSPLMFLEFLRLYSVAPYSMHQQIVDTAHGLNYETSS